MTPVRVDSSYPMAPLLALVREAFASMDGRIEPPSSATRLTVEAIGRQARDGEVWVIEAADHPVACVFLTVKPHALYLGKLAVAGEYRGRGYARDLVALAARRASALGLPMLELQTRIELTENHAAFQRLGFAKTGETRHPGYTRPTSITMRKTVGGAE